MKFLCEHTAVDGDICCECGRRVERIDGRYLTSVNQSGDKMTPQDKISEEMMKRAREVWDEQLSDLCDRGGIKHEIRAVEPHIMEEIHAVHVEILAAFGQEMFERGRESRNGEIERWKKALAVARIERESLREDLYNTAERAAQSSKPEWPSEDEIVKAATTDSKAQGNDCLNSRTVPNTPVGECITMFCGCNLEDSFKSGVEWLKQKLTPSQGEG